MKKINKMRKFIGMLTILAFMASIVPGQGSIAMADQNKGNGNSEKQKKEDSNKKEKNDDSDEEDEAMTANSMLNFKMKVRWGNVIGDPQSVEGINFKGSVSVEDDSRVSLENTLKFEDHNANADKITGEAPTKISWNSLTYNDWDGVMVTISAPASSYVTIDTSLSSASGYAVLNTPNIQIRKTAQELFSDREEIVKDAGSGREVVVKSYKVSKNPNYFLKVYWGKIERSGYSDECNPGQARTRRCVTPLLDATGSFKIDSGGKLNLVKTLRFEAGDEIVSSSDTEVKWKSALYGGIDGIVVDLKLDADTLDANDKVTINFDKHGASGFPKSYSIVDLYHNGFTKDIIDGSAGYGVAFEVWKRPNRSLIRIKDKPVVYMIEDGVKMSIQSPAVFYSNGLSFDDVEVVEQDEADTYADSEPLNYADGTIVREDNRPEVYVVANGQKKHILDPIAFTDLGYSWNNVLVVPENSLAIFATSTPMNSNSAHPEGALIRVEGAPTVYVVEGGKRVAISDIQLFNARKYDWNKVLVIKEMQAKKFDVGSQLAYPDGSLIKDNSGKVYVVDHGEKRWIRSYEDFKKGGYKDNKILAVDNSAIGQLHEGDDVVANDVDD